MRLAHEDTPRNVPFLVHLAEGVDGRARSELDRLESEGGLAENTVVVHGVALSPEDWRRARSRGARLVWCPSSNRFLFGQTANVNALLAEDPEAVALGTDSRLTGARDLLEEMREARSCSEVNAESLLRMVTTSAARLLRLPEAGRLEPGVPADFVVVPPLAGDAASSLLETRRDQLRLVCVGGRPFVGSPDLSAVFEARSVRTKRGVLDAKPRLFAFAIAHRFLEGRIREPGLTFFEDAIG